MKYAALVIGLLALAVGVYAVAIDVPDYSDVRSEWMLHSGSYGDPAYERLSDERSELLQRVESEGVFTIAFSALGLILGIVAMVRKNGGAPAIGAIVASVGAGICGAIIATTHGVF